MAKPEARFRILGEDATAVAFRSALGNAQATATRMSGIFRTAFAGISAAAIGGVAMRAIEMGDELNKAAIKAGVSGKAISELAHAAKMADVDLGGLSTALRFMQTNLSKAASGEKAQAEALAALGVELKEIQGLKADKQFELLADRIGALGSAEDKARAATELFGKSGAELLPLFEDGAQGIRAAREEAERLGLSFSDEQLKKLADADDAMKRLKGSFDAFAASLTARVAPSLSYFLEQLSSVISGADMARVRVLQEEIRVLEDSIARGGGTFLTPFVSMGAFGGAPDVEAGIYSLDEQIEKAAELRKKLRALTAPGRGGRGVSGGPPGFTAVASDKAAKDAAEEAEKAALKQREAEWKAYQRDMAVLADAEEYLQDQVTDALEAGNKQIEHMGDLALQDIMAMQDEWDRQTQIMREISEDRAAEIKGIWDEGIFRAFEDGLDGMLECWIKTLQQMAIQAAATNLFNTGGVGGFFSSLFGGFRAKGGPIEQGKWYIAGEKGPEPIWGGGPGAYAMGYGRGGGGNVTIHVDARGAQEGVAKQLAAVLPAVVREAVNQSRAAVMSDLDRRNVSFA